MVAPPPLKMPPPLLPALLPENVLLITVKVPPLLKIPPPSAEALFPEKVLLVTVSVPRLAMPPPFMPLGAVLLMMAQLVIARVPLFKIAPPEPPPLPLSIERYFKVRVAPEFTTST